jgi:hypothetical protein
MTFMEIANSINGISCPVFGVSWTPPNRELEVARKIIIYLEDRRILYSPYEMESPNHCMNSIIQIREFLTITIGELKSTSKLSEILRGMRASCR